MAKIKLIPASSPVSETIAAYNKGRDEVRSQIKSKVARMVMSSDNINMAGDSVFVPMRNTSFAYAIDGIVSDIPVRLAGNTTCDVWVGEDIKLTAKDRCIDLAEPVVRNQIMREETLRELRAPANGRVMGRFRSNGDFEVSMQWDNMNCRVAIIANDNVLSEPLTVAGEDHESLVSAFYSQIKVKKGEPLFQFNEPRTIYRYMINRQFNGPAISDGFNGMTEGSLDTENIAQAVVDASQNVGFCRTRLAVRLNVSASKMAPVERSYRTVKEFAAAVYSAIGNRSTVIRCNDDCTVESVEENVVLMSNGDSELVPPPYQIVVKAGDVLKAGDTIGEFGPDKSREATKEELSIASSIFVANTLVYVDDKNYVVPMAAVNRLHVRPDTLGVLVGKECYDEQNAYVTLTPTAQVVFERSRVIARFGSLVFETGANLPVREFKGKPCNSHSKKFQRGSRHTRKG
jgi:hypothetical protein